MFDNTNLYDLIFKDYGLFYYMSIEDSEQIKRQLESIKKNINQRPELKRYLVLSGMFGKHYLDVLPDIKGIKYEYCIGLNCDKFGTEFLPSNLACVLEHFSKYFTPEFVSFILGTIASPKCSNEVLVSVVSDDK
jgi:hypothetical protein